ncbi:hypothetical protein SH2C18_39680 [Clostridium sediminicola]|uniref:helix-turn-helix transcriptional regulator n=1 Tax=Clostridium sediminicola TaxID=3114879 RepID=UPI0031F226C8
MKPLYKLSIKEHRTSKQITQKELAAKIGISQNYLSEIENNKYDISISLLLKIGKVLKICPFSLIECYYISHKYTI